MKNEKNDLKATDIPGHARASRSILSSFLPSRSVYSKEKREGYDLKASAGQVQFETTQSACAGSIRGLSCLLREVREAAEVVLDAGKRLSGASARLRPGPVLPQLGSI